MSVLNLLKAQFTNVLITVILAKHWQTD